MPERGSIDRRTMMGAMVAACLTAPIRAAAPLPAIRCLDPRLDRIIAPDARIETIATGIQWAEGPVWLPDANALLFSDPPANLLRRWTRSGGVSTFLSPSGAAGTDPKLVREPGSNGMALAADGRLLIADSGSRAIVALDRRTMRRTTLVDRYRGKRFNSPNDLTVARSGALYFTDPPYGFVDGDHSPLRELEQHGVYRWAPGGEAVLIDGTLTRPNGVALSPDQRRLYISVSDEAAPRIMAYDLGADGLPRNTHVFLDAKMLTGPGLPDGMKVAADGTLFCSGPGGMYVLTPEAKPLGLIEDGAAIANCAFGEAGSTLFLTASDRVLRLPLTINGWRA